MWNIKYWRGINITRGDININKNTNKTTANTDINNNTFVGVANIVQSNL